MRILALETNNRRLKRHWQLLGLAIGPATPIRQALQPMIFESREDLVAGLPRDPEFLAQGGHLLAILQPDDESHAFIFHVTLLPRHSRPPLKGGSVTYVIGMKCYPEVGLFT